MIEQLAVASSMQFSQERLRFSLDNFVACISDESPTLFIYVYSDIIVLSARLPTVLITCIGHDIVEEYSMFL